MEEEAVDVMADFKKGKDQMGTRYNFQKDTPSDLLPQA